MSVAYVVSPALLAAADRLPANPGRASLVHALVEAYGLLPRLRLVTPPPAGRADLAEFHDEDYLTVLEDYDGGGEAGGDARRLDEYGLTDDCAVFSGVFRYARLVAGATLAGARLLAAGEARVAINWTGGRHHGRPDRASGYCFVNDIVLGLLTLRARFPRVLYVDIDVHHGDGVERAFLHSPSVLTVSFHKRDLGFFPGSGALEDTGRGAGRFCAVNVPLRSGADDAVLLPLFAEVMEAARARFAPGAVVFQAGADALSGDPTRAFNLSSDCYARCLRQVLRWGLPTLVLGGGGYHNGNTAKCWTLLTAVCVQEAAGVAGAGAGDALAGLSEDLPEHARLDDYAGDCALPVPCTTMHNENTREELARVRAAVLANIARIPAADDDEDDEDSDGDEEQAGTNETEEGEEAGSESEREDSNGRNRDTDADDDEGEGPQAKRQKL